MKQHPSGIHDPQRLSQGRRGPSFRRAIGLVAILIAGSPAAVFADSDGSGEPRYDFEIIGEGLTGVFPSDIDNQRRVYGFYTDGDSEVGFVWQDGNLRTIERPGADFTYVNGVSNNGLVAGHAIFGEGFGPHSNEGFVIADGFFIDIKFEPFNSWAFDVNNRGEVVGIYCDGEGNIPGCANEDPFTEQSKAYLLDKQGFRNIDPPGTAGFSAGTGINNRGSAVGSFYDGSLDLFRGFELDQWGVYTLIDGPGATYTEVRGINNRGQIVGGYDDQQFRTFGFVREPNNTFHDVEFPGAARTTITGINDRGDLCGITFTEDFALEYGFIARRKGR